MSLKKEISREVELVSLIESLALLRGFTCNMKHMLFGTISDRESTCTTPV
jgi:hypothetical protein